MHLNIAAAFHFLGSTEIGEATDFDIWLQVYRSRVSGIHRERLPSKSLTSRRLDIEQRHILGQNKEEEYPAPTLQHPSPKPFLK